MKATEIAMSRDVVRALHDAGLILDPPEECGRVVLDLQPGDVARLYVEKLVDPQKLSVALEGGLTVVTE